MIELVRHGGIVTSHSARRNLDIRPWVKYPMFIRPLIRGMPMGLVSAVRDSLASGVRAVGHASLNVFSLAGKFAYKLFPISVDFSIRIKFPKDRGD